MLKQNNVYYCAIDAVSGKGCYLSWKIQMFGWKCGQWSSKWFHLLAVLILTTQHVRKSWNAHHKIISQHLPRIHYLFSKYSNHISEQCFWLENQDTTPEINSYGNPPVYTVELGNWSIFQPGLIKPEGVWNPQLGLSKMFGEKLGEDKKIQWIIVAPNFNGRKLGHTSFSDTPKCQKSGGITYLIISSYIFHDLPINISPMFIKFPCPDSIFQ